MGIMKWGYFKKGSIETFVPTVIIQFWPQPYVRSVSGTLMAYFVSIYIIKFIRLNYQNLRTKFIFL